MIDLTPNRTPDGEKCGTCRFAGTHTHAEGRREQTTVRCRRFPPVSRAVPVQADRLADRLAATHWPYATWDDWCGEWEARDPNPDQHREAVGFQR